GLKSTGTRTRGSASGYCSHPHHITLLYKADSSPGSLRKNSRSVWSAVACYRFPSLIFLLTRTVPSVPQQFPGTSIRKNRVVDGAIQFHHVDVGAQTGFE